MKNLSMKIVMASFLIFTLMSSIKAQTCTGNVGISGPVGMPPGTQATYLINCFPPSYSINVMWTVQGGTFSNGSTTIIKSGYGSHQVEVTWSSVCEEYKNANVSYVAYDSWPPIYPEYYGSIGVGNQVSCGSWN
ncbi:hypothetical protein FNH22_13195 [Fulvivirga sp. M361]|uniref:hypothetical protein n=1 Tax=Fulvivirga sp. M361 TaxID=2594266 RepID=UPI00117AB894|nr:hypothetical protein [Fulvivirga sp. M361]TRX58824.1 hypothetical protein FNH22_13195 [Fulvivirga sp. M361]